MPHEEEDEEMEVAEVEADSVDEDVVAMEAVAVNKVHAVNAACTDTTWRTVGRKKPTSTNALMDGSQEGTTSKLQQQSTLTMVNCC